MQKTTHEEQIQVGKVESEVDSFRQVSMAVSWWRAEDLQIKLLYREAEGRLG